MATASTGEGYFMFRVEIKNRRDHSAIAGAAYVSDQKLFSERDGRTRSYRPHSVAPVSYIMTPKNAPDWASDRERLWNEVEKVEVHEKAQMQRLFLIALPVELSEEKQQELLTKYVQENFVNKGMVADVNIHRDHSHNPHAHIYCTMRPFDDQGNWAPKSVRKKVKDQDGNIVLKENGKPKTMSVKTSDWDNRSNVLMWRKNWANELNLMMEKENINLKFSSSSFEDQGKEIVAERRMSRENFYLEFKAAEAAKTEGKEYKPFTDIGKLNQKIKEYNQLTAETNKKEETVSKMMDDLNYRKLGQPLTKEFLQNYDRVNPLTDEEREAYRAIKKRAKTTVDLGVAKLAYNELKYGPWHDRIVKMTLNKEAEGYYMNRLLRGEFEHDKGKGFANAVGMRPDEYNSYVKQKIQEYNSSKTKLEGEVGSRLKLVGQAELVLNRESKKYDATFKQIYGSNPEMLANFESPESKFVAVEEFIKYGQKINPAKDYSEQVSIAKQVSLLEEDRSVYDDVKQFNSLMNKELGNYRYFNKNISLLLDENQEAGIADRVQGSLRDQVEQREYAREKVYLCKEIVEALINEIESEEGIEDNLSLIENVQIYAGVPMDKLVKNENLYGPSEKIFTKEKDSFADKFKFKVKEKEEIELNNEQNETNSQGGQALGSLLDQIGRGADEKKYYKTKNKKRRGNRGKEEEFEI